MVVYAPGTLESDPKKQNMALQQQAAAITTNTTNIATNTANIATNTTNIATNTSNISTLQTTISGYEAAWTSFTPAVTAQSGTFTSVSAAGAYSAIGKLVHFIISITITTVGTAAGNTIVQLPLGTAARTFAVAGVETNINGNSLNAYCNSGSSNLNVRKYDTTTAIAASAVLTVTGIYERS
jgi:hypothetical protein